MRPGPAGKQRVMAAYSAASFFTLFSSEAYRGQF